MKESGFESMEHDNQRQAMASEQSKVTPDSVAMNWNAVNEMKGEAMDEAYGMAGKATVQRDMGKAHSQFRDYNWS